MRISSTKGRIFKLSLKSIYKPFHVQNVVKMLCNVVPPSNIHFTFTSHACVIRPVQSKRVS